MISEHSGPLLNLLSEADPHLPGLNFSAITRAERERMQDVRFAAHRGSLRVGGDDIDALVVTLRHADSADVTIYFSQLGQILAVKTFAGYDLFEESLSPGQ